MTESVGRDFGKKRLNRLPGLLGLVDTCSDQLATPGPPTAEPFHSEPLIPEPLVAVVSSRLGRDPGLQKTACRFLVASVLQCRSRGGTLLIAAGSAMEPWARRAAELFDVPAKVIGVDQGLPCDCILKSEAGTKLTRDRAVITLADRVDGVHVRRGGEVEKCLAERVARLRDGSTRVAVTDHPKCAATKLIHHGAVGWYDVAACRADAITTPLRRDTCCRMETRIGDETHIGDGDSWMRSRGEWLVHCTRGCRGAWPGESERQYRDSILLGDRRVTARGALETLARILRGGRLLASAVASCRTFPVVCFSAVSLTELIGRRCFRSHLGRWDYEPYGVAVRKRAAIELGIEPVIYGTERTRNALPAQDRYRFQSVGKTYDWKSEQEWRSPRTVDLRRLDADDVRLFVRCPADRERLPRDCPWPIACLVTS